VDVPYFLSKYDPDPLRYYLTATAPETRDTEFSWEDFVERNNHVLSVAEGNELVAMWGTRGVANRMLSFAYKRFDGVVPEPGPLDDEDRALLAKVEAGFETVGELYNACKFRGALSEAIGLAREANGYPSFHSVQAWIARRPGSRSRRTGRRRRRACTSRGACAPSTT